MTAPLSSPYAETMGFIVSREAGGQLLLAMEFDESKRGRPGYFHGGALAGILETIAYMTLADALGADDRPQLKPVNVTVSFMRGAVEQTIYARATIERLGKRIANVEAMAWQDDPAKPVAMAQMNILLDRNAG